MHRLWPLLLLLLLQPRSAAAEVLSYGYMAYVETVVATPAAPPSPRYPMHRADDVERDTSVYCHGERSDRVPPETTSRPGPRVRAPQPARLVRAYAGHDAGACSPHCERLPYHATAPPLT
jgi:hypothetical protein